jgi:hypothetical protein
MFRELLQELEENYFDCYKSIVRKTVLERQKWIVEPSLIVVKNLLLEIL